ncbi:MAG: cobalamin B12-binding domain-containing protein [Candidatus Hydrogenedentes bacterium]|nr:cobalamin B12-binding domain-containing protein [Candidatus Hydrogenedentota bacterium]
MGVGPTGAPEERSSPLSVVVAAYNEAIYDTDRDRALHIVRSAVDGGVSPESIVFDVVMPSLEMMVKSISETFDANLAQHFMAAQIAEQVSDEMIAKFRTPPELLGHVVIGTSPGDFHGLGKRIVTGCLRSQMIGVIDLGLNVPADQFVNEAVARHCQVIAVSSMMVHTAMGEGGCLGIRQILQERGLEDRIKIIAGGAPYRHDPELYKRVGADAFSASAIEAGGVVRELIAEVTR